MRMDLPTLLTHCLMQASCSMMLGTATSWHAFSCKNIRCLKSTAVQKKKQKQAEGGIPNSKKSPTEPSGKTRNHEEPCPRPHQKLQNHLEPSRNLQCIPEPLNPHRNPCRNVWNHPESARTSQNAHRKPHGTSIWSETPY